MSWKMAYALRRAEKLALRLKENGIPEDDIPGAICTMWDIFSEEQFKYNEADWEEEEDSLGYYPIELIASSSLLMVMPSIN